MCFMCSTRRSRAEPQGNSAVAGVGFKLFNVIEPCGNETRRRCFLSSIRKQLTRKMALWPTNGPDLAQYTSIVSLMHSIFGGGLAISVAVNRIG